MNKHISSVLYTRYTVYMYVTEQYGFTSILKTTLYKHKFKKVFHIEIIEP